MCKPRPWRGFRQAVDAAGADRIATRLRGNNQARRQETGFEEALELAYAVWLIAYGSYGSYGQTIRHQLSAICKARAPRL